MFDDFDTELQVEDRFNDIAEQENAEDWAAEMAAADEQEFAEGYLGFVDEIEAGDDFGFED